MQQLSQLRVAFAGTPEFSVPSLAMLIRSHAQVPLVLTQPDRRSGRGRKLTASPVKQLALEHNLLVEQPVKLDDPDVVARWGARPELLLVVAYGLILPQWLLDWPEVACVNVHASLLPRWRGAAPIQHAILAGDSATGVSIMQMQAGLDSGPVFARRETEIRADDTAGSLSDRLGALGADLAAATLPPIAAGRLAAEPQDEAAVTLAPKISKSDAPIDFTLDAARIERRVRAFNPWPVAEARLDDGRRLRIWEARALDADTTVPPGAIVGAGPAGIDVATGAGLLRIVELQAPAGKRLGVAAYLAANSVEGAAFESV